MRRVPAMRSDHEVPLRIDPPQSNRRYASRLHPAWSEAIEPNVGAGIDELAELRWRWFRIFVPAPH